MTKNKKIIGSIIIALIIGIGIWVAFPRKTNFITTPGHTPTNIKGGKVISLTEAKPSYKLKGLGMQADFDQSDILDVFEALWNIPETNKEPYLALMDANVQKQYEEVHQVPSGSDEKSPTAGEPSVRITHWVDIESGGKTYRIVVGVQTSGGIDAALFHIAFVQQGNKWIQTFDLDGNDLKFLIGSTPLNELKNII